MQGTPVIQDKAVVAISAFNPPIGEASGTDDTVLTQPMADNERQIMIKRLEQSIATLMVEAMKTYQAKCHKRGTKEVDPDYITRLSTNEFFFYTKEPLELKEFETLQNNLAQKAKVLPPGIQLILSSFAVKTEDNKVMNVTPHLTSGQPPAFNFIVKNYTSSIDVRYKIADDQGSSTTLDVLDIVKHNPSLPMPAILVDGVVREFTFNNIIPCKTPGGTPFLTAVDVCLDHAEGVARSNIETLAEINPAIREQPISHLIVSNWIALSPQNCIGTSVMHVDPVCSPQQCKEGVKQKTGFVRSLEFGSDPYIIYDVKRQPILANNLALNESLGQGVAFQDIVKEQQDVLLSLATLLRQGVPAIQAINFNTCENMLAPVKGVQFFFSTEQEASAFASAIQQTDPDLFIGMARTGDHSGYVECSPELLLNPGIRNTVIQNYQTLVTKPSITQTSFREFKQEYSQIREDALRSEILEALKADIDSQQTPEELEIFVDNLKNQANYKILARGQELYTAITGDKPDCIKTLEAMIEQKERSFDAPDKKQNIGL